MGAGVGSAFGGAKGAQWGFTAGVMLAGVLFPPRGQRQDHGKLDDLRVSGSQYGSMIPQVYGRGRVGGIMVWVQKDAAGNHLVEHSRPIKASKGGSRTVGRSYTYSITMAVAFARGPIVRVRKIRANDKVIYDSSLNPPTKHDITIYLGTEEQEVDPTIEAAEGVDQWTAYRGTAYAVFADFDLGEYGNSPPNLNFEIDGIGSAAGSDGLLAWYRFEDDPGFLQDSGPNNYDLTQTGSGAVQVAGPTGYGEALDLPTALNTLESAVGDLPAFTGDDWSMRCFFKHDGGIFVGRITYRSADFYSPAYLDFLELGGGVVGIEYRAEVDAGNFGVGFDSDDYPQIKDGQWHRVAGTRKLGGQMRIYLDDVLIQAITTPFGAGTITSPGSVLEIANSPTGSPGLQFDEVEFWERELSPGEVVGASGVSVATILEAVYPQVGLEEAQWDTADAEDKEVPGFVIGSRVDVRQGVRELLMLTDLDTAEVDGQLVCVARGGASVVTIPEDDLGAYVEESGVERNPEGRVEARRMPTSELPYRLDLEYLEPDNNFQQGQATAIRHTKVAETQEQITVSTPLSLDAEYARRAAETLLYRQWFERVQFVVSLPPAYMWLAPGDIVTIPVAGSSVRCRVEQMDLDPLGVIQLTLVQDSAETLVQTVVGPTITPPFEGLPEAAETALVAWSGNALLDEHAVDGKIGFYVGAGGPLGEDWPGAVLFWSRDGGTTYDELIGLGDNATLGNADTVLASPPGGAYDLWDDTNVVDVEITSGDPPETSSDAAVLNGANAALLGEEIIQFVTATSLGANVYRLSRLLRGRRGTESFGGAHAGGERFSLLEDGRTQRVTVDFALLGKDVLLKAVTLGMTLADASPVSLTITGAELLPYAVADVEGARDGSNNLTLTWHRRARAGGAWADLVDVLQPEDTLAFEVDVMSGMTVLRTIETATETASYLASEQTTDGLTPGDPVSVRVYQIGAIGRGYVTAATV